MNHLLAKRSWSACVWLAAVSCVSQAAAPGAHQVIVTAASAAQPVSKLAQTRAGEDTPPAQTISAEPASTSVSQLIVGNETGLELWAPDGRSHRVLSVGAAMHPHRIDDHTVLAVRPKHDRYLLQGASIEKISLRDGSRSQVAELPEFSCSNSTEDDPVMFGGLDIQDPSDFALTADGRVACINLMDRNINMANVLVRVRVELDSGRVTRWLAVGEDECRAPADMRIGEPSEAETCKRDTPAPAPTVTAPTFPYTFDERTGYVQTTGEKPTRLARLHEYTHELTSPSGRWLVLGGDIEEGDYSHRRIVLCDRTDGALYPVRAEAGPWPAPLTAAKRGGRIRVQTADMADVVGETDLRWLGDSAETEVLVVDQLVIQPNAAVWSFEGELAR
ncbi:MAG: hypothetical protein RL701_1267 [Pseudomonadota bacterium]